MTDSSSTTDAHSTPETPDAGEPAAAAPEPKQAQDESPAAAPEIPDGLPARVEAALLTVDRALPAAKLAEVLGGDEDKLSARTINAAIEQLNREYEQTGRSFRIEAVADGWKVMTLPQYADVLETLHKTRSQNKLSPAALETLAIIAYKQPVMRAEIEAIRGAASGEVIRSLMERHLIKIVGRAEIIGRPMQYGTTKTFLEVFGLSSLKDLPPVEQFKSEGQK